MRSAHTPVNTSPGAHTAVPVTPFLPRAPRAAQAPLRSTFWVCVLHLLACSLASAVSALLTLPIKLPSPFKANSDIYRRISVLVKVLQRNGSNSR